MDCDEVSGLCDELIAKSFPTLQPLQITIHLEKNDSCLARVHFPYRKIWLSKWDVERMGVLAMTGVLAHELMYMEVARGFHWLIQLFNIFAVGFSARLRAAEERRIDTLVVKRGYGAELLASCTYHDRYYKAYGDSDGLTIREISKLMQEQQTGAR